MKWKLPLGLAVVSVALLVVLWGGFGRNPHEVPFMMEGKPAPAFTLRTLQKGEEVSLASLKGRPVILNFWASWCGPCVGEHPVLEWGARELGDEVHLFGVIFEDTEDNARAFLRRHGDTLPQLVDPRSQMAVDYGVAGVPETYFIDAEGTIRGKHVGPIDAETLAAAVRALREPAPGR
jgi:cytochrome c biogenesis protein CcmG, thiol:disulfide interchange protein DsbE